MADAKRTSDTDDFGLNWLVAAEDILRVKKSVRVGALSVRRERLFQVLCVDLRRLRFYRLQNRFGDGLGARDICRTARRRSGLAAF